MPKYTPISKQQHGPRRWQRYTSYGFAQGATAVPVVASEATRLAVSMPFAFSQQGNVTTPMALMGVAQGRNVFVGPEGRWLAGYVPAAFRQYPFAFAKAENDQFVLCIDEESGLVTDNGTGEPFFDEAGEMAGPVRDIVRFLQHVEADRKATINAASQLTAHDLLMPLKVRMDPKAEPMAVTGFFQVDEKALNGLSDDAFLALRRSGALVLAYMHLVSLQHWGLLARLADGHKKREEAMSTRTAELFSAPEDGDLQIDWSRFKAPE